MYAPPSTIRVFVSSTWKDLASEQRAVEKVLQRIRETRFVGMEHFGSRNENARSVSLDEVDRCHVYVGIIGGRYGSGITEEEYRRARERNLPCFIYFKDEAAILPEERESDPEQITRLAAFKEELRQNHTSPPSSFTTPDSLAAGIAADLHNWLFNHYLPRLVSGLSTDYAARIRNFLTEYVGTPEHPVPFGGREADFVLLNQWLENPDSSPYLLLAAPAGRGKSALLTRWSAQLLARDDVAVVFFPVSVRFRTNLSSVVFAALATRLVALHGEKKGDDPNTPAEVWRGVMTEYLTRPLPDGKSLVVILDGIDEAADWMAGPDLFPLSPPKGLRIVLSARYRAGDTDATTWLRTVGWERPSLALTSNLSPLTPSGIADILQRMGFPLDVLGKRVGIIAELHRLSEGDPLLVRLYVDDLWARGEAVVRLSPENLQVIRPGLKGYFDRWWEDQHKLWGDKVPIREPVVQAVLNILACALGPLERPDILRLAPPDVQLSTWDLEEVLRDIQRFVIGDGRQQGYAFSRPRLRTYFHDRLAKQERQDWEERFLKWGEETIIVLNKEELLPKEASPYLVQYYGGHLERGEPGSTQVMALASRGWKQAWEAVENSYAGFLNDVDRSWRTAEQADMAAIHSGTLAPNIAIAIRCALCHASIHSLAGNIPPVLLEQLVAKNVWSAAQGFTYACHLSNPKQQAEAISRLAPHLSESLRYEALRVVRRINHLSSQRSCPILR